MFIDVVIDHIIENLDFNERLILLNYLSGNKELTEFEKIIYKYFENKFISVGKEVFIEVLDVKVELYIKSKDGWTKARPEEKLKFESKNKTLLKQLETVKYGKIIGFMKKIKTGPKHFKTRNMSKKNNTGSTCGGLSKEIVLTEINDVLQEMGITEINNKDKKGKQYLCVKQELLLRLADKQQIGKKRWFFSPEEIQKLENLEKDKKNKN